MKKPSYFPSRLFRWFLIQQILFSTLLFVLLATGLLVWVETVGFDAPTAAFGRALIIGTCLLALGCVVLISLYMARRIVGPLGRLIEKTIRLRELPAEGEDLEPEELTLDEPGEWFELERAVNRLGRDLRQKTIRLSREKTEIRAIMSAVSEAILAISKEKNVLFYNTQFAYLFNLQTPAPHARISELLRSPDVLEAFEGALKTGAPARKEVQIAVAVERLPRHFLLSVSPLKKKHNQEIYGAVGILHDITELKQAERIRIEFVGNVSHELRTPLTAVNGYLQTLKQDFERGHTEDAKQFLDILTTNVSRLRHLVEDLLDLSALESGKELEIGRFQVSDLTESVLSQMAVTDHRVHLRYDFESMQGDSARVAQVLRNLIENAVRYVPKGRDIEIHWRRGPEETYELRVKDNGPGIAPEHQARLFERFYRVDEGRARTQGGTGIGLSLVKHIMQRHGGRVYVQSELGIGAEFVCEFPAQPLG